jgi:hypothetical protein
MAVGLLLSLFIANFMEDSEEEALNEAAHRLCCSLQYAEDTFIIQLCGPEKDNSFSLGLPQHLMQQQHPLQHKQQERWPLSLPGY